jgi:hypothetical protein
MHRGIHATIVRKSEIIKPRPAARECQCQRIRTDRSSISINHRPNSQYAMAGLVGALAGPGSTSNRAKCQCVLLGVIDRRQHDGKHEGLIQALRGVSGRDGVELYQREFMYKSPQAWSQTRDARTRTLIPDNLFFIPHICGCFLCFCQCRRRGGNSTQRLACEIWSRLEGSDTVVSISW